MPETPEQWAAVAQQVAQQIEAPVVCFGALGGRSPEQWRALGISLVIDPFTVQVLQVRAMQASYADFFAAREPTLQLQELFATYNQLDQLAGFEELYAIEDMTSERP